MELFVIVAGMALLGLAALRYGQDSRDLDGAGPWHTWRDVARRNPIGASSAADPVGVELTFRVRELHTTAAREALLRSRPPAAVGAAVAPHRAAVAWLGAALVRLG